MNLLKTALLRFVTYCAVRDLLSARPLNTQLASLTPTRINKNFNSFGTFDTYLGALNWTYDWNWSTELKNNRSNKNPWVSLKFTTNFTLLAKGIMGVLIVPQTFSCWSAERRIKDPGKINLPSEPMLNRPRHSMLVSSTCSLLCFLYQKSHVINVSVFIDNNFSFFSFVSPHSPTNSLPCSLSLLSNPELFSTALM